MKMCVIYINHRSLKVAQNINTQSLGRLLPERWLTYCLLGDV